LALKSHWVKRRNMAYKEGGLIEPLILGEGARGLTKPEASGEGW